MKPPRLWPRMDERCSYTAVILALSVVNVNLRRPSMASLVDRITRLVRSPQGRRLADRAQQLARDPSTRRKIEDLRGRLMKKR
jgi:hypothetical protein